MLEHEHLALGLLEVLLERVQGFLQLATLGFALVDGRACGLDAGLQLCQFAHAGLGQRAEFLQAVTGLGLARVQLVVPTTGYHQVQRTDLAVEPLVPPRLADLALQRAHFLADLVDDVVEPHQVALGAVQLALRLLAAGLVLGDARALFEQVPQVVVVLVEDRLDHRLLDDRVRCVVHAAVEEEIAKILQPAGRAIQEVVAAAVAGDPALDRHFREVDRQPTVLVLESERHLGHAHGPVLGRALEDDVVHLAAAQLFRRLLAEHPAHRVNHVGLAAAVGTENGCDTMVEFQPGTVDEGLESLQFDGFQTHRNTFPRLAR